MKLLLDQGLPRTTARLLGDRGIDAEHVGEIGMAKASDEQIIAEAARREAVIVTLDADFHALLAAGRLGRPSVIRFRIEGLTDAPVVEFLRRVIAHCGRDLETGVVVEPHRVRVRMLPLP